MLKYNILDNIKLQLRDIEWGGIDGLIWYSIGTGGWLLSTRYKHFWFHTILETLGHLSNWWLPKKFQKLVG
jgi:hypothetical protein